MKTKQEIDGALKVVEEMLKSGAMSKDIWAKCIVSLAYEYMCADEQQEALVQIARVPNSYYKEVQIRHMKEDSMYAELVAILGYKLIQLGVVGEEEIFIPTMPEARA